MALNSIHLIISKQRQYMHACLRPGSSAPDADELMSDALDLLHWHGSVEVNPSTPYELLQNPQHRLGLKHSPS